MLFHVCIRVDPRQCIQVVELPAMLCRVHIGVDPCQYIQVVEL